MSTVLDRRDRKAKERGLFDGETNLVGGTEEYGNFHRAVHEENYESSATQGQFQVLENRIKKIDKALDSAIQFQQYEREQENNYKDYQSRLYSSIFNMTVLEILLVLASAAYSVHSLRKFFVKKHIM